MLDTTRPQLPRGGQASAQGPSAPVIHSVSRGGWKQSSEGNLSSPLSSWGQSWCDGRRVCGPVDTVFTQQLLGTAEGPQTGAPAQHWPDLGLQEGPRPQPRRPAVLGELHAAPQRGWSGGPLLVSRSPAPPGAHCRGHMRYTETPVRQEEELELGPFARGR